MSVTNLPATQTVSKVYSDQITFDADDRQVFDFGQTINVSTLIVDNRGSDDTMAIHLTTVVEREPGVGPGRSPSSAARSAARSAP